MLTLSIKLFKTLLSLSDLISDAKELIKEFDLTKGEKRESFFFFRKFHTLKARFGQFSLKIMTNIINDIETALYDENYEILTLRVKDLDHDLKNF